MDKKYNFAIHITNMNVFNNSIILAYRDENQYVLPRTVILNDYN